MIPRNRRLSDDADHARADDASRVAVDALQLEVAIYIESMSAELCRMAKAAQLEALSYFLEMARLEASIQVERRAMGRQP